MRSLKQSSDGWGSLLACFLAIINLFLASMLLGGGSGSTSLVSLVQLVRLIFVCIPIFLVCLSLGIAGAAKRESLSLASLFLTLSTTGAVIFFSVVYPANFDTPQKRAVREQRSLEQRRLRDRDRANGDIRLNENSLAFRLVNTSWWTPTFIALFATSGAILLVRRRVLSAGASALPVAADTAFTAEPLPARCPKCAADVTTILSKGGSICSTCGTTLVLSRLAPDAPPERAFFISQLLFEGSPLRRIPALLGVVILILLALLYVGLLLAGEWIASKRIAMLILVGFCALILMWLKVRERAG
jgi:hypothetical protein